MTIFIFSNVFWIPYLSFFLAKKSTKARWCVGKASEPRAARRGAAVHDHNCSGGIHVTRDRSASQTKRVSVCTGSAVSSWQNKHRTQGKYDEGAATLRPVKSSNTFMVCLAPNFCLHGDIILSLVLREYIGTGIGRVSLSNDRAAHTLWLPCLFFLRS